MSRLTATEQLASWMMGIGVLIALLGFRGYRYIPMTEEERQREQKIQVGLNLLHALQREAEGEARMQLELRREELKASSLYHTRRPPYRYWGIAGLVCGCGLIGIGYTIWYRRPRTRSPWTPLNEDA